MKRKLAVLLTAATVFSTILPTTCMAAEKKADIPEGTTISFWHAMGGVNGEALDYLVNKFNEENEYGIKVDSQYQGEYDDEINKLKSAQLGNMGADLVQIYDIGTRFMIDSGWVIPMQDMIDSEGYDVSDLEPNITAYYTVDDKLYSMPFNSSTPILYYNKDMLDKAGADIKEPGVFAKMAAKLQTAMKMAVNDDQSQAAKLLTEGCNMGIETISGSLNEYRDADSKSVAIAERLRTLEEKMVGDLQPLL